MNLIQIDPVISLVNLMNDTYMLHIYAITLEYFSIFGVVLHLLEILLTSIIYCTIIKYGALKILL